MHLRFNFFHFPVRQQLPRLPGDEDERVFGRTPQSRPAASGGGSAATTAHQLT